MSSLPADPELRADVAPLGPVSDLVRVRCARWVGDYVSLTKPRIISLLLFTSVAALIAAEGRRISWPSMLAVCGGGFLAAGGANAINCAIDGELDRAMGRTRSRPVAVGRISAGHAAGFGLLLISGAVGWLWAATYPLAGVLALSGAVWYIVVYTMWLKRRSSQNIVIGGAAGCFPPLVGWAAATGRIDVTATALALVVLLWTPPHFWALATLLRDDYRRAGVPMLPVVASPAAVARQIRLYAVGTVLASVLPVLWGGLGLFYLGVALVLGYRFAWLSWQYPDKQPRVPSRLFHQSLAYLFLLFLAAAVDRLLAG